jgi:hypothetical protein
MDREKTVEVLKGTGFKMKLKTLKCHFYYFANYTYFLCSI